MLDVLALIKQTDPTQADKIQTGDMSQYDDAPLIQSLLDNPSASTSWLHFPGGRYRINDSLQVTRNRKKITGEGSISDGAASLAGVTEFV